MNRLDPDVVAGTLVTLLCVAAGVPILLVQLAGHDPFLASPVLWWVAFAGFLTALVASTWFQDALPRRYLLSTFGALVLLAHAVVLLAPHAGWTPILLVFTAALSSYVVTRTTTTTIVIANTFVAGLAAGLGGGGRVEVVATALLYLLLQTLSVVAVLGQLRDQTSRRQLAEAHTELRATTALLADTTRENERLRIARDLHDVVGHQITALALELEVASHHTAPPAAEHVTRARRIAKDLLADMRATVARLRDTSPDLATALAAIVEDLPSPRVHLDVADDLEVDQERLTTLVRCVQEIVTNAIRHAEAANLWIDVDAGSDGATRLTARDDGRGTRDLRPGNGLTGIRERVERHGGAVTFAADKGFEVVATVPAP